MKENNVITLAILMIVIVFSLLGSALFYSYDRMKKEERIPTEGVKIKAKVYIISEHKGGKSVGYYYYINGKRINSSDSFKESTDYILRIRNKIWIKYLPSDPELSTILRDSGGNPIFYE